MQVSRRSQKDFSFKIKYYRGRYKLLNTTDSTICTWKNKMEKTPEPTLGQIPFPLAEAPGRSSNTTNVLTTVEKRAQKCHANSC